MKTIRCSVSFSVCILRSGVGLGISASFQHETSDFRCDFTCAVIRQSDGARTLAEDADPATELRETIACPCVGCRPLHNCRIDDMVTWDGVAEANARRSSRRSRRRRWRWWRRWWLDALRAVCPGIERCVVHRRARFACRAVGDLETVANLSWNDVGVVLHTSKRAILSDLDPPCYSSAATSESVATEVRSN